MPLIKKSHNEKSRFLLACVSDPNSATSYSILKKSYTCQYSLSFENAREMYRTHALLTNDLYINFVSCSQSFVFLVLQPENIYFSNLKRNNTCF